VRRVGRGGAPAEAAAERWEDEFESCIARGDLQRAIQLVDAADLSVDNRAVAVARIEAAWGRVLRLADIHRPTLRDYRIREIAEFATARKLRTTADTASLTLRELLVLIGSKAAPDPGSICCAALRWELGAWAACEYLLALSQGEPKSLVGYADMIPDGTAIARVLERHGQSRLATDVALVLTVRDDGSEHDHLAGLTDEPDFEGLAWSAIAEVTAMSGLRSTRTILSKRYASIAPLTAAFVSTVGTVDERWTVGGTARWPVAGTDSRFVPRAGRIRPRVTTFEPDARLQVTDSIRSDAVERTVHVLDWITPIPEGAQQVHLDAAAEEPVTQRITGRRWFRLLALGVTAEVSGRALMGAGTILGIFEDEDFWQAIAREAATAGSTNRLAFARLNAPTAIRRRHAERDLWAAGRIAAARDELVELVRFAASWHVDGSDDLVYRADSPPDPQTLLGLAGVLAQLVQDGPASAGSGAWTRLESGIRLRQRDFAAPTAGSVALSVQHPTPFPPLFEAVLATLPLLRPAAAAET
jgi:hypothetical protein